MTATYFPTFRLSANVRPLRYHLDVRDLARLTTFYSEVIGLTVLEANQESATLGTPAGKVLLELSQLQQPVPKQKRSGLFHGAFLLEDRAALGQALRHYLTRKAPLSGASDHLVSEALYLEDPEGNGIEVYRDRPVAEWTTQADGEIVMTTEPLDAEGVLAAGPEAFEGFSSLATLGHIHLMIADVPQSETFYTDGLGFALKTRYGKQADFLATGDYHHHLGMNVWNGRNLPAKQANEPGLADFTFGLPTERELAALKAHLDQQDIAYQETTTNQIKLIDPSGLTLYFEVLA